MSNEDEVKMTAEEEIESQVAQKLGLNVFLVPGDDDPQLVVARKKKGLNHFVFTRGMKKDANTSAATAEPKPLLRCFRLAMRNAEETDFDIYEYETAEEKAWVAGLMMQDHTTQPEKGQGD